MKTIFIATDFSENAQHAADFANDFAGYMGCKVVLFHAYQIPLSIPESYVLVKPEEVRKTAEEYLLEESNRLRKSPFQPIEIVAEEGAAVPAILEHVKKYSDPLIVVGKSGMGGMFSNWFGSTSLGLVKASHVPVLVIPESIHFKPFQKIVLAAEIEIDSPLNGLNALVQIGTKCKSSIDVVRVLKPNVAIVDELSYRSGRLAGKLTGLDWNYAFPRGEQVFDAINEFVLNNDADLISIIPQHHNFLHKIFNKSESKKLIQHTHIPLLLLPEHAAETITPTHQLQEQLF